MAQNWTRHDFENRTALAAALAGTVAGQLREAIAVADRASLAVSGGSTPGAFFAALAQADLDWEKVTITLVDERFVDETSPRSNAALAKSKLLQGLAAKAKFVPLYQAAEELDQVAQEASAAVGKIGLPLDVVVLGMGNDGHTASFFPDAQEIGALLDPSAKEIVASVHAVSAGEPRLTLTLPVVASARFIALHIEGAEKAETLKKALGTGSNLPIRRVIDAAQTPVEIFWAP